MSLEFIENPFNEKLQLLLSLIKSYQSGTLSSDEIHYLLDIIISMDISKDNSFIWKDILEELKNYNIKSAFYSSDLKDLNSTPELFWESWLKSLISELKTTIEKAMYR